MPIPESRIREEALLELANAPNGFITTTNLIVILEEKLNPQDHDNEIINNRSDTHFSQKVRNLVSHRDQPEGLQSSGLATYDKNLEGWTITDAGRIHVARR